MEWLAHYTVARNLNHAGGERMKKTAFARGVVLMVVAVMIVTVLTGCKTQTATFNWGTDPTYQPFEYADANNKPTGFDVELMEAIATKMGKTSNLTSEAFDGLLLALEGKKFDAVCAAMTITPLREKEVSFSIPYYLSLIHISEPTRLGMISYAVFCLKKKKDNSSK